MSVLLLYPDKKYEIVDKYNIFDFPNNQIRFPHPYYRDRDIIVYFGTITGIPNNYSILTERNIFPIGKICVIVVDSDAPSLYMPGNLLKIDKKTIKVFLKTNNPCQII